MEFQHESNLDLQSQQGSYNTKARDWGGGGVSTFVKENQIVTTLGVILEVSSKLWAAVLLSKKGSRALKVPGKPEVQDGGCKVSWDTGVGSSTLFTQCPSWISGCSQLGDIRGVPVQ